MEEIRFIPGTGKAYGCSKDGRIYSYHQGEKLGIFPKELKTWSDSRGAYVMVTLCLDGVKKNYLVHRLVAQTWIPNPDNLSEVDHIDNNPKNNSMNNLQWISKQDNLEKQQVDRGSLNGLRAYTQLYSPEGELLGCFHSLTSACEWGFKKNLFSKSGMMRNHTSKGYYVLLENDNKRKNHSQKLKSKWALYSPNNEKLGVFNSKREAGTYIKKNIRDISVKKFSDMGKAYGYYVIEESVETKLEKS